MASGDSEYMKYCQLKIMATHVRCGIFLAFIIIAITIFQPASVKPAMADWRKELGVFRVGIVSAGDTNATLARSEPFRLALSEALGIDVELFAARDHAGLVNALASARIEYAVLSATAYALTWALCECIEPIAIPTSSDNSASYRTVLISGPGGPDEPSEIRNSPVGGLAEDSIGGFALAVHLLRQEGFDISADDIGIEFRSGAEAAVDAFLAGEFKTLIGWSSMTGDPARGYSRGTLAKIAEQKGGTSQGYRIIWHSPPIPHHPHVIRKSLDSEVKRILRELLPTMYADDPIAYDSIEPVYGGGFLPARHGSFTVLVNFIRSGILQEFSKEKTPLQ